MKLSPQSEAVVRKLRLRERIESGEMALGPLDDQILSLLNILIDEYEDLRGRKGKDQAAALRTHYHRRMSERKSPDQGGVPAAEPGEIAKSEDAASGMPANWRLVRLRCRSIRGIARPGEEFEFQFHGESNLIYGPNGSGKSSIPHFPHFSRWISRNIVVRRGGGR